jgi:hypothetical protein
VKGDPPGWLVLCRMQNRACKAYKAGRVPSGGLGRGSGVSRPRDVIKIVAGVPAENLTVSRSTPNDAGTIAFFTAPP